MNPVRRLWIPGRHSSRDPQDTPGSESPFRSVDPGKGEGRDRERWSQRSVSGRDPRYRVPTFPCGSGTPEVGRKRLRVPGPTLASLQLWTRTPVLTTVFPGHPGVGSRSGSPPGYGHEWIPRTTLAPVVVGIGEGVVGSPRFLRLEVPHLFSLGSGRRSSPSERDVLGFFPSPRRSGGTERRPSSVGTFPVPGLQYTSQVRRGRPPPSSRRTHKRRV